MVFELLKKDFLLVKKYLLILIIFAVGTPVYIIVNMDSVDGGFWGFFITMLFLEYVLFNIVSRLEEKSKGSAQLCTASHKINAIVEAKYLFVLLIFICTYIIYTAAALAAHIEMDSLNMFHFGIALLIITIYFSIIIPLQYQFGYKRTRFVSFAIVFILPFAAPVMVKWFYFNNFSLHFATASPQVQNMFPCFLALAIGLISMGLSIRIYSKRTCEN